MNDWNCDDERHTQEVEALMRAEHQAACKEAQPPAAGIVWWRAQRRLRDERLRAAARPMTVVHAISGACAVGVAAALLQFLASWLRQWISAVGDLARLVEFDVAALSAPYAVVLLMVVVASLVIAPLAVYVALSDD